MMFPDWRPDTLRNWQSRGAAYEGARSLADLHEARRVHLSQFFTPDDVVAFMWRLVAPAMARAQEEGGRHGFISVLDNSFGAGRMFQLASPEHHALFGIEADAPLAEAVAQAAEAAGFVCDLRAGSLEIASLGRYSVGLLNPPFSIPLSSPTMTAYDGVTSFGRFGSNTSAVSHWYALSQAVDACDVVVAILPEGAIKELLAGHPLARRLQAVYRLPVSTFNDEGANVSTAVALFGGCKPAGAPVVEAVRDIAAGPTFIPDGLQIERHSVSASRVRLHDAVDDGPAITLPVTGDKRVVLAHRGRHIVPKFSCGLMQAETLNAIYRERIEAKTADKERNSKEIRYVGQGALDIEAHLRADDPEQSFADLLATIQAAGGEPVVTLELKRHFARRLRASEIDQTPLRHFVWREAEDIGAATGDVQAECLRAHVVNPAVWGSPAVKKGEAVTLKPVAAGAFEIERAGKTYTLSREHVEAHFRLAQTTTAASGWQVVHEGRAAAFPELAARVAQKAIALGIRDWTWDYQFDDLVEVKMGCEGVLIAWQYGLGKARLAAALCLMGGTRNLICVEAGGVDEMRIELEGLPLDRSEWQIIDSPETVANLRRINVISYTRLRMPVSDASKRITYAHRLRRRIHTVVADEGGLLRNHTSDQSRALWQVSAKVCYALDGTPCGNYPRNVHPVSAYVAGDGTARQPYGIQRAYLPEYAARSMAHAGRGLDVFRERHMSLEWCTNEFAEELAEGAKREVPKILNVHQYREWLAPIVKRRVHGEPDVAKYVKVPDVIPLVHEVQWDSGHLAHYLQVAEEFAQWFIRTRRAKVQDQRSNNMVALLARIGACVNACNSPHVPFGDFGTFGAVTSKQRAIIRRLQELSAEGRRAIVFAHRPELLQRLADAAAKEGVSSLMYTGDSSPKRRAKLLNSEFRSGKVDHLMATFGTARRVLNLPEADTVLLAGRSWSHFEEDQAIARIRRPKQQKQPYAEYFHLPGSIDDYQAQMVEWKRDAEVAGLDWGTPQFTDSDFLHIDTLLGRFCEDLAARLGVEGRKDLRTLLASVA